MPQRLCHVIAVVGFLTEVVQVCRCDEAQSTDDQRGDPKPDPNQAPPTDESMRDIGVSPGVLIIAVMLTFVLIGILSRTYQVVRGDDRLAIMRSAPEGMRPIECGACHEMQYVTTHGRIFICFSCNSANRIPMDIPRGEQQELVAPTGPLRRFKFKKGGENYWQELRQEEIEGSGSDTILAGLIPPPTAEANRPTLVGRQMESDGFSGDDRTEDYISDLPQCSVCMDLSGCMVLLPCAHGGVCEECATRIAQNRASGGAHCPHCRSTIHTLVKIHEITGDLATGIEYRIPMARAL